MFAGIVAIDHSVPAGVQTAEQLAPLIGRSAEWIRDSAGVSKRHCSRLDEDPACLVASIARPMLEKHGEPDLIIHAGAMPRQLIPDTSVFVARELGLSGVPGYTLNATCLSFVVALQAATALIKSGSNRRILISTCEFATRGRNFEEAESASLIGDAAAVALLESQASPAGIEHFAMETWPAGAELSQVRGGGVMHPPNEESTLANDNLFHMEGEKLLRFVVPRLRRFLTRFCNDSGVDLQDIELFVPHQASAAGLKILPRLGIPAERTVNILAEYGNCVAASIPMALSVAVQQQRVNRGQRILLLGTAAGVSIGAALIRW